MTTSVLTLTTSWQLVATGSVYVSLAVDTYQGGASLPNDSTPYMKGAHVHIGTTTPGSDTFAYHEIFEGFNYLGSQKVYMRVASGTRVIKYTSIV